VQAVFKRQSFKLFRKLNLIIPISHLQIALPSSSQPSTPRLLLARPVYLGRICAILQCIGYIRWPAEEGVFLPGTEFGETYLDECPLQALSPITMLDFISTSTVKPPPATHSPHPESDLPPVYIYPDDNLVRVKANRTNTSDCKNLCRFLDLVYSLFVHAGACLSW
jgi:hypothetical protein